MASWAPLKFAHGNIESLPIFNRRGKCFRPSCVIFNRFSARIPSHSKSPLAVSRNRPTVVFQRAAKSDSEKTDLGSSSDETSRNPDSSESDVVIKNLVWLLYASYLSWLLFLPFAPGEPIWAIKQETIQSLGDLSLNFFFILPAANAAGFHFSEAPVLNPTAEALFNLVNAWSLMFGPLLVSDVKRFRWNGSPALLWSAQMFLTNIFLIPYMAFRLSPTVAPQQITGTSITNKLSVALLRGSRGIGITGLIVAPISVLWFIYGRPDSGFGGLEERWSYFAQLVSSDRPTYAFLLDIVLYSIFQAWIIGDNVSHLRRGADENGADRLPINVMRFLPCLGLGLYLVTSNLDDQSNLDD